MDTEQCRLDEHCTVHLQYLAALLVVLEQRLGELHELGDLLHVVLHDVEHAHLGQVQRLGELVLRLAGVR